MIENKLRRIKASKPYFERLEDLRRTVVDILEEGRDLTIQELYEKTPSFRVPSTRHLTAVLVKDPKRRFKCENRIWHCHLAIDTKPMFNT